MDLCFSHLSFYLCYNKIIHWIVHSNSQSYFTYMISFDHLNNPKLGVPFHFTDKNQKFINYPLPKVIRTESIIFPQICCSSSFLHTNDWINRLLNDLCQKLGTHL